MVEIHAQLLSGSQKSGARRNKTITNYICIGTDEHDARLWCDRGICLANEASNQPT
jgi:hypothetical protein